jgi:nucleotide-binding universal stress UspA family protein
MAFKSILVVVTHPGQAEAAITAGSDLALAHEGHLDVLALGVDHSQLGYAYLGAGAAMMELDLDRATAEARAAEAAARSALGQQNPTLRWALDTVVAEMGGLTAMVGTAAGFADLVVQCRPYGADQGPEAEAVVEAALFDGRAPVLILPGPVKLGGLARPRRIVLAWNQSAEGLAAAKAALPFLKAADMVDVTVVDPPARGPERSDPGGMLCQFLVRHGVKAEVTVLARTLPTVAEELAAHAMDRGADMMVMGAYGHSRLREAVLGGATRKMLESAAIPVLMAH